MVLVRLEGIFPDEECKYCYCAGSHYAKNIQNSWATSLEQSLDSFKHSSVVAELSESSLCIDCGANVGAVTDIFLSKGATVHSFEPHPVAFKVLSDKFSDRKNLFLYQQAVLDKEGTLKLFMYHLSKDEPEFWSQGASLYETKLGADTSDYVEVEVIDLVKFIESLGRDVDVLKLDIEGGEYDILLRLIDTGLYKKIKYILVETHDRHIKEIIPKGNLVRELIEKHKITNIDLNWV